MDIVFASTSIRDELFQLHLHFFDRFLLFNTHGENDLSCDYNVHCGAVRDSGDINPRHRRRIMLLLLVLAVKKREVSGLSFLRRMRKEDRRNGTKVRWNPLRLNPKGTYVGSGIENVDNGKKK